MVMVMEFLSCFVFKQCFFLIIKKVVYSTYFTEIKRAGKEVFDNFFFLYVGQQNASQIFFYHYSRLILLPHLKGTVSRDLECGT